LLFYATPEAFSRDFIRQVEIQKAIRCKAEDPSFVLFALPRRMGFGDLSRKSLETFGTDLASYASQEIKGGDTQYLGPQFCTVARDVLDKVLSTTREQTEGSVLQMQLSTRELLADETEDVLRVDAVNILGTSSGPSSASQAWLRVHEGLLDVKRAVSSHFGRPRLRIHGSRHLTTAFILGHTFPSTTCELEIRTKKGYWSTDCDIAADELLIAKAFAGSVGSEALYVEISANDKRVRQAVRRYISRTGFNPFRFVRFDPSARLASSTYLTNSDACAIAWQVRHELSREVAEHEISEMHFFAAMPQGLAAMIGRGLNAMPPAQLYEYDGIAYHPSYRLR
jgi:hypothetical protein